MLPQDLIDRLSRETFIRTVEHLAETRSTNSLALLRAETLGDAQLPAIVVADQQTAGRGRGANRWWSDRGSLTFSLLIDPGRLGIGVEQWPALSLTTGAAVAAAVQSFAGRADVRLKWPNDVLLDGRKLAGILVETPQQLSPRHEASAARSRLVIGVGINVATEVATAPPDVRARAASLHETSAEPPRREDVLVRVLQELDRLLGLLATRDRRLQSLWRQLCLLTGRSLVVEDAGRTISGTCLGIDDDGALRVQTGVSVERLFSGIVVEYT